jgi:hypothetical protein
MTADAITAAAIEHYVAALAQFEHLRGRLTHEQSQRLTHGELASMVQVAGSELLRRLIQGHLDQRGREEPMREHVVGPEGVARTHRREGCTRCLETRFGEVIVTPRGYGGRGLDSVFPLDAELHLPPDKPLHGLREVLVEEVVGGSFDEAVEHLARAGGGQRAKRQAEEVSVPLSQDFDAFYAQPFAPPQTTAEKGKLLVISADGKGIVMHPNGLREATRRAMEREEHKQHPRTPKQILDPEQQPAGKRPRPQYKRTWARVKADQGTVIEPAFAEAVRRDPDQQLRWVVLPDGQEDLLRQVQAAAKRYKVDLLVVQDFVHVLEYRWKAAYALHPENTEEGEDWVLGRASAILPGRAPDVAVGLRRAPTRKQLSQSERKPVDYIDNNQEPLQYDRALAHGLPIATGVIEGACRHLVKDRMDSTGARWGLQCAEAILKLRSLKVSGDLATYLTFHFAQEQKRNYPGPPIPPAESLAA